MLQALYMLDSLLSSLDVIKFKIWMGYGVCTPLAKSEMEICILSRVMAS